MSNIFSYLYVVGFVMCGGGGGSVALGAAVVIRGVRSGAARSVH